MEPGVEPLRRIGRRHLTRQHEDAIRRRRRGHRLPNRNICLSSPNRSRRRRGGRRLGGRNSRRSCAPSAGLPAPRRRRRSATEMPALSLPGPVSAARARLLFGNIFAPAHRRRPGTRPRGPRCCRGKTRSRRDCGFRFPSAGTRSPHRGIALLWCSAALSASHASLSLARRLRRGPPHVSRRDASRRDPGLRPRYGWLVGKSAQRPVPKSWGDPGVRHVRCVFPKGTTRPLSGAVRQRSG